MQRRAVAWGLAAGLALATISWPTIADACSCRSQAVLMRPPWPAESGLLLVSESLELDCAEPSSCHWRSVHVYTRAEPGEAAKVAMVLPFVGHESLTLRWGGRPVEILADEQLEQARAWVRQSKGDQLEYEGVYVWLADDGQQLTVELEIEGKVQGAGFDWDQCCRLTALEIRHRFVPRDAAANSWRWAEYRAAAVDPDARTHVRVNAGRGLRVEVGRERRNSARRGPASFEVPSEPGAEFAVLERPRLTGGPFIALGGAILDANPARGRIGWEHACPYSFLFYSAALETDFTSELTFVPAVEITHGGAMVTAVVFPRAGFGVGVPVQFLPDPRPGLRAQASLSWIVFSLLTTFDWLPELPPHAGSERPNMFKLAFLGQFSF